MAKHLPLPPEWLAPQIDADTHQAREEFRERRLSTPLTDFNKEYPTANLAAKVVIGALDGIIAVPVDNALIAKLVSTKERYAALRSLTAPPVSKDDLETLLDAKLNRQALEQSPDLANALANLLKDCLDPQRFPWVAASRTATAAELKTAQLATAVLTAASAVQARRRGDERKQLEGRVCEALTSAGFQLLKAKPKDGVRKAPEFPKAGTFYHAVKFGGHNADFVIGLRDGRILAIECKASNSTVNGFKRLNKEVVVDAGDWRRNFGESVVIAAAALRGVFNASNVLEAQEQKVHILWWHRISALEEFLAKAV